MYMYYGQFASNKMYLFLSYYVDHFFTSHGSSYGLFVNTQQVICKAIACVDDIQHCTNRRAHNFTKVSDVT